MQENLTPRRTGKEYSLILACSLCPGCVSSYSGVVAWQGVLSLAAGATTFDCLGTTVALTRPPVSCGFRSTAWDCSQRTAGAAPCVLRAPDRLVLGAGEAAQGCGGCGSFCVPVLEYGDRRMAAVLVAFLSTVGSSACFLFSFKWCNSKSCLLMGKTKQVLRKTQPFVLYLAL